MKRLFDFILALLLLAPGLVLCIICMVAIRLDTKGNPLFVQVRVGRNQAPFRLVKLRTMFQETGDHASHLVSSAQVTSVGGFLRRFKLDELPQLVNVIMGDMSFVGPRPCLPNQDELIREREALGVFSVRPGITGPAQVAGIDMSTPKLLAKVDRQYIDEQSFAGDLKLIVQTGLGKGTGDANQASGG